MELEKLVEKVDFLSLNLQEFQCCNCAKVLLQPTQSTCGHLFCNGCIRIIFSAEGFGVCPVDKQELVEAELFSNAVIGLRVLQLHIKCPNSSLGCVHECKLSEILQHLQICKMRSSSDSLQPKSDFNAKKLADVEQKLPMQKTEYQICPQGCRLQIKSEFLVSHLKSECYHRFVECPHCELSITLAELDPHKSECDSFPIPCPYSCGIKNLPRIEMKRHSQDCSARLVRCRFFEIGCQFQDLDEKVWKHEQEAAYHLDLLLNYSLGHRFGTNLGLAQLNANFQELKNDNLILKDALDKNNDHMIAIKHHTTKLTEKVTILQNYLQASREFEKRSGNIYSRNNDTSDVKMVERHVQEQLEDMRVAIKNMDDELQKAKLVSANVQDSQKDHIDKINLQEIQLTEISKKQKNILVHDGVFIWKIRDFGRLQLNAKEEQTTSLFSDSFYTHKFGYKMCLNIYPYGFGPDKGEFFSFFIVLLKGSMDQILKWPFSGKITLSLLDQIDGNRNFPLSFTAVSTADAFKRPMGSKQNPGYGFSKFIELSTLVSACYLVDDTLYLKAVVEVTK